MKFDFNKKLDLEYLGSDWKGCYLSFSPLSVREAKSLLGLKDGDVASIVEKSVELLKEKFIEGKLLSGGVIVDVTKDDLEDLPVEIVKDSISLLSSDEKKTEKQ